jgi:hypothetical protein
MVAKGWYDPADDVYPLGYMKIYKLHEDGVRPVELTAYNQPGNRTRGDLVGEFTTDEWTELGQVERCGWWWNWVNRQIHGQAERLPGRVKILRLEDAITAGDDLGVKLLGEAKSLGWENRNGSTPVTGWESYVGEMAEVLGYPL